MGFVATDEVEELTYDFNPYADVKGTIPEPTTDQVDEYRRSFFASMQEIVGEEFDPEQIDNLLEMNKEVENLATEATALLTGISAETLFGLPFRVRNAFLGWILGVFLSPEA